MIASSAVADEKKKKGDRRKKSNTPSATQRFVKDLELTADQKEKIAAIEKQFAEKLKELAAKRKSILTDEQRAAQRDALKAAKDAGKTGADSRKVVTEALKLTDEQNTAMKAHAKVQQGLNGEIIAALKKVLTAEQQEKLPKARGAANRKRKGKKKKDAA